jgi:hypothetical protein
VRSKPSSLSLPAPFGSQERSVLATVDEFGRAPILGRDSTRNGRPRHIQPPPGPFPCETRSLADLTEARLNRSKEETDMRQIIGAAAFMATALTAAPATAHDYPYCLQGRDWGYPGNCQFTYLWQCEATASGTFSYCGTNPRFAYGWQPRFAYGRQPQRRRAYQGW